ncbi:inositol monophosphatase family protein [Sphingobacterium sp. UME9]|uniref:inositol monophosphatase family protein n=1 Tax=Sphingobacterium sp. UME9 TaxID=1862316 RepID=UPI001602FD21|nr:inositol monophosphatase family protein [Sphingobacterium sp. UME9]MBB1644556.1 hypothetical protein [Sphingobacterium sp. UME9]
MYDTERPNPKKLKKELDFVFQKSILPHIGLFSGMEGNENIDSKKIKQLIIDLSCSIEKLGDPVINRYRSINQNVAEFWLLGFVRDKGGTNSAITITKFEQKRPTVGIVLFPITSVVYSAIQSERAHELDFCESSIRTKRYFDKKTEIEKYIDDDRFLRIVKGNRPVNMKTENYVKSIIDNHNGAIRLVNMETPLNLIEIAKNRADIYVHLKPVLAWELGAFDLIVHSCGYMVTGQDGIMPIEYTSDRFKVGGFIAKNNFEYDTLDFKRY